MRNWFFLIGSLALVIFGQGRAQAGFLITNVASVSSETEAVATVNVRVYGLYDNVVPDNALYSFGVAITINGVTPNSITSVQNAPSPSQWAGFDVRPTPTVTSNSVTFQGNMLGINNLPITGTAVGTSTLIGSFNFDVSKLPVAQSYTVTAAAAAAPGTGGENGLVFFDAGFFRNPNTNYSFNPAAGIGTITAVPEPSSLAMLALATSGYLLRRSRRRYSEKLSTVA